MHERIPAFAIAGEAARLGERGTVFRDWDSGVRLDGYTGLYVYMGIGDAAVMRTWIDQASGERAVAFVRSWGGWREHG
jgi:hypothetical protein